MMQHGSPHLLDFRGVTAAYDGITVLHGLDLSFDAGEVVAVLGRNGVGKTTLVNTIFNMGPRITGNVAICGHDVSGWATHRIAKLGLSLVPQGRGNFPGLTVEENLRLAQLANPPRGAEVWTLPRIYEAFPRLAERRRAFSSSLSGGERQLLALGRALLTQAQLMILDEPSEGLAPLVIEELMVRNIRRLSAQGLSILLVEQNVAMALKVCTRAVVLANGRIVFDGNPGQLAASKELQREHLGV